MDFSDFIRNSNSIKEPNSIVQQNENDIESVPLKRGMMVRIIYKPDSVLNSYKGYLGEIIYFNKQKNIARIFLHASLTFKIRQFPIDHLRLEESGKY
jgi:hypothetical protein